MKIMMDLVTVVEKEGSNHENGIRKMQKLQQVIDRDIHGQCIIGHVFEYHRGESVLILCGAFDIVILALGRI